MLNDICIPAFDDAVRAAREEKSGDVLPQESLLEVFRKAAGIGRQGKPVWFTAAGLGDLPQQPDEARLIEMAERVWPHLDWLPEQLTERNRASWYRAVVRQRQTSVGWVLDEGSSAPAWGNGRRHLQIH